jgi:hypothetical protein
MKKLNRNSRLAVLVTLLALLGAMVPLAAQTAEVEFVIVNNTGGIITELVLSPAVLIYEDSNIVAFQDIKVDDGVAFNVALPAHFAQFDSFDFEITLKGGKNYATSKVIRIDVNEGIPILRLTTAEKGVMDKLTNSGRVEKAGMSAATGGWAANIIAKKAATKIASKVILKIVTGAIPVIGPVVSGGILVVEGIIIAKHLKETPDDLLIEVEYQ